MFTWLTLSRRRGRTSWAAPCSSVCCSWCRTSWLEVLETWQEQERLSWRRLAPRSWWSSPCRWFPPPSSCSTDLTARLELAEWFLCWEPWGWSDLALLETSACPPRTWTRRSPRSAPSPSGWGTGRTSPCRTPAWSLQVSGRRQLISWLWRSGGTTTVITGGTESSG